MFPLSCNKYSEAANTEHLIHNSALQKMLWHTAARRLQDRGAGPGKREGAAPGVKESGQREGIKTQAMERHGGFSRPTAEGATS